MMTDDALHNDMHPLLHPDIFALVAKWLGECIGGPDFCAWLSTCKRALRLSEREDVWECHDRLHSAYRMETVVKISQQRILPDDLIRRMIGYNPMNLFDLPIHRRTYERCQIACHNMLSIVVRLQYETKLTDDEQFAIWRDIIARVPSWIQEAERRWHWDTERMNELAAIGCNVDCTELTFVIPTSAFVKQFSNRWKEQCHKRNMIRRLWRGCKYSFIGGMIGCAAGLYLGGEPVTCIFGSIATTLFMCWATVAK